MCVWCPASTGVRWGHHEQQQQQQEEEEEVSGRCCWVSCLPACLPDQRHVYAWLPAWLTKMAGCKPPHRNKKEEVVEAEERLVCKVEEEEEEVSRRRAEETARSLMVVQ